MPEEEPCAKPKPEREPLGWASWFLLAVVIASLAGLTQPKVIRSKRVDPHTEATRNLRQIGFASLEFDSDYGSYPSDATAARVTADFPAHGHNLSGRSSNALFRQFFVAGITQSEYAFYAKVPGTRKPDGDITPGKLLEKGEVGYPCVAGLTSAGNPARPIIFLPLIPGTKRFDPKPFGGSAVFLRGDNSVTSLKIHKDGKVLLDGIDILSVEHPIWEGKAPDIRYPE